MADAMPITEAQLLGMFLESVFLGFFLITFVQCIAILLRDTSRSGWRSLRSINWPMLVVAILLFVFATLDVALSVVHNIQAFVFYSGEDGPTGDFSQISDWINIMRTVTVVFQTTIGDGMLIYRCWIVYERAWLVIAFPLTLWLTGMALDIWIIYVEETLRIRTLIVAAKLSPLITAFWVLTITLNITATSLIVLRLWKVDRESSLYTYRSGSETGSSVLTRARPRSNLRRAMIIIIEAGAMYTAVAVIACGTYIGGSNAAYFTSDVEVQIVGIAFNLIIIRASQKIDFDRTTSSLVPLSVIRAPVNLNARGRDTETPTIQIKVEENIERYADSTDRIKYAHDDDSLHGTANLSPSDFGCAPSN
ncbi:hypothetical protein BDZ89DRAFT_1166345 [Hymenopellis radicata]|nr:hypothetical protein BDZ89DRAFT_1166345 [Hymenopellis radicata]